MRVLRLKATGFLLTSLASATVASAQQAVNEGDSYRSEIFVGSVPENYLRYLQTMGLVPLYPWVSRSFSPRELDHLIPASTAHPWSDRFAPTMRSFHGIRYDFVRPGASLRYNTGFAYGSNDGPIWAGRGLTSAIQAGVAVRWGPTSLTLAPMAFRAENKAFFIVPNTLKGPAAFANALYDDVDLPQRFGDTPYQQLDPGQSTFRIDLPIVSFGASTANMGWGPGTDYPLLLGNNAAGFPHIFLGTSEPLNILIGKIHANFMWGELAQSPFSTVTGPSEFTSKTEPGRKRFTTGVVIAGEPRGLTGLEIGGARFFHSIWPRSGLPRSYFTKIFQAFLKHNIHEVETTDPRFPPPTGDDRGLSDNQLIEIFGRWTLPHSGFEISGEYGREDFSADLRDLIQQPDHSRFYNIGARKVLSLDAGSMTAVRFEAINAQVPSLVKNIGEGQVYLHGVLRQGHTNRGQLLGAAAGVGAFAGSTLGVDHYTKNGRWTASWVRDLNQEMGNFDSTGVVRPKAMDVSHSIEFEMTRFVRDFDVTTGLTFVRDFNRDFSSDAANINIIVALRYKIH